MNTPFSDTVRNRKGNALASTQRFLPIAEIRSDCIILKNGGIRAVLQVEALNFNLKSETEQQGIIAGYGAFVNTLTFPMQIVMRSSRTNIDEYLSHIRTVGESNKNQMLKDQTMAYANFMQKLIEVADIMQKRFYVVVPVDRSIRKRTMVEKFFDWISPDDSAAKAKVRTKELSQGLKELNERVDLVASGLNNIGLHTKRMGTRELIELNYQVFNPKTSQNEKLPREMDNLEFESTVQ